MRWFKRLTAKCGTMNCAVLEDTEEGDAEAPYVAAPEGVHRDEPATVMRQRGHLFLCYFFDMRVATVVACSLNAIAGIAFLFFDLSLGFGRTVSLDYYAVALSMVGIFGALNYEYLATGVSALGLSWLLVVHFLGANSIPGIIVDLLVIYPTTVISYELYQGILARDNYYNEFIEHEEQLVRTSSQAQGNDNSPVQTNDALNTSLETQGTAGSSDEESI
jgi:hypothetical protein